MFKYFFFLGILTSSIICGEAITPETIGYFSSGGCSDATNHSHTPIEVIPHKPIPQAEPQPILPVAPPKIVNPYAGRSGVIGLTGRFFSAYDSSTQLKVRIHEVEVKDDGDCTLNSLGISRSEFIDAVVSAIEKSKNQQELEEILTKTQELMFNGTSVSFFSMDDPRLRANTMRILKDVVVNPEHPSSQKALADGYDGKSTSTANFSEIQFKFDFSNKDIIIEFFRSLYSRTKPKRNIPTLLLRHVAILKKIRFRTWMLDRGAQVPPFSDEKNWKAIYNPRESTADINDQSPEIIDMISIANHTNLGVVEWL